MMQPQPTPQPAPQQAPPQMQLDPEEISRETGFPIAKVEADIQQSGATSKEELYPQVYGQAGGIDPSVAQGGMGMPAPDDQSGMPPPMAPPPQGPPTRMRAQAAMTGQPMPDEPESPAEAGMEAGMPGAEAAEGIQPNVAAAAHSSRVVPMHRSMKGKPVHHAGGKHRGRRG